MLALLSASAALAQPASVEDLVSAVVRINTHITPDGRTVQGLGREREGSGILIDADGLVLTIGYLMVEAYAAEVVDNNGRTVPANVVGYDHETGFGLLRTIEPLKLKPMALGKSAEIKEGDPVLVAS
ncbi:MAG TPA: S1C family serine protease, partial [Xanthobacteraceae bacterium]|nr:S1C family serine protease [Xanthobacteraceae bacterium]